jgi:hypothetical protein
MDSFQVFLLLTTLLSTTIQVVRAADVPAVKEITLVKAKEEKPPSKLSKKIVIYFQRFGNNTIK